MAAPITVQMTADTVAVWWRRRWKQEEQSEVSLLCNTWAVKLARDGPVQVLFDWIREYRDITLGDRHNVRFMKQSLCMDLFSALFGLQVNPPRVTEW